MRIKKTILAKKTIKKAILSYQEEQRLLEQIEEENTQSRIKHAKALIFYTKSWLETKIKKRKRKRNKNSRTYI